MPAQGLAECAELPGETIEGVSRAGRELDMDLLDIRMEKSGTPFQGGRRIHMRLAARARRAPDF